MKIVALAGGVGGAKLVHGLIQCLPPDDLTVVVNTADDFRHFGLHISPDLDTVCYTAAGLANPEAGWGRGGESWRTISEIATLGGPDWFRLGDLDLATHLERTRQLDDGQVLSDVVLSLCKAWRIKHRILPMTDQPVRTIVETVEHGELAFQDYFVRLQCRPRVRGFRFDGAERASPAPGVLKRIAECGYVVICPSNPWVSIAPILAVPGIRPALTNKRVLAVSPIIGGKALRGPAAKMYSELGVTPSALAVAQHYRGLATDFILDRVDGQLEQEIESLNMRAAVMETIMQSVEQRRRLAEAVLNFLKTA